MNNRRKLLHALGVCALAGPIFASAQQQGKVWRVGFLAVGRVDLVDSDYTYGPLTQGLRELGYVIGKNLVIEWRSADGKYERLPELAAELVRLKVDVLAVNGTPASHAAQKATTSIPILMVNVADPVGASLVNSLARPGGNRTGLSNMINELGPKILEMLRAIKPNVARIVVLWNPPNTSNVLMLKDIQAAAQKLGVIVHPIEASTAAAIASAFAMMARQNAEALVVLRDPFFQQERNQIVALAAKQRLPSIGTYAEFVEAGGLLAYGTNLGEINRRAATYIDKILKGAKPGDLPVEQPMRFDLVVNLKTAKALGFTMPPEIMVQATRVIE
jgi:putative ABC transport system substrate-binding protein